MPLRELDTKIRRSRLTQRVMEHPGTIMLGAVLAGGVIAGALWAGFKLRQYRFAQRTPYDVRYDGQSQSEYEAVGI